jgi:excisionase family DNA binding protein
MAPSPGHMGAHLVSKVSVAAHLPTQARTTRRDPANPRDDRARVAPTQSGARPARPRARQLVPPRVLRGDGPRSVPPGSGRRCDQAHQAVSARPLKANYLTLGDTIGIVLDGDAAGLLASLAGDALRRGLQLTADEHGVIDRLDQVGRAATAARPSADADTGAIRDGFGDDAVVAPLLSTPEAGRRLGLSPRRVRALAAEGHLKGERFGRTWRFPTASVEQLRKERECQPH